MLKELCLSDNLSALRLDTDFTMVIPGGLNVIVSELHIDVRFQ